jgi:hypothetical protein
LCWLRGKHAHKLNGSCAAVRCGSSEGQVCISSEDQLANHQVHIVKCTDAARAALLMAAMQGIGVENAGAAAKKKKKATAKSPKKKKKTKTKPASAAVSDGSDATYGFGGGADEESNGFGGGDDDGGGGGGDSDDDEDDPFEGGSCYMFSSTSPRRVRGAPCFLVSPTSLDPFEGGLCYIVPSTSTLHVVWYVWCHSTRGVWCHSTRGVWWCHSARDVVPPLVLEFRHRRLAQNTWWW